MATTTLFAELIVIGLQGTLWLAVLLYGILRIRPSDYVSAQQLGSWAPYLAVASLGWFYTFGAVLDRVFHAAADATQLARLPLKCRWIKKKSSKHSTDNVIEEYYYAGILTSYYQYVVARWRILRATFFNLSILLLVLVLFGVLRGRDVSWPRRDDIWIAIIVSAVLTIAAYISFFTIDNAKDVRGAQIREVVSKKNVGTTKPS